jgi:hypothetical protein
MSEDDWESLHVAGWLHDCGKVTTPEFVIDKATKLETIYDRIHEVRTAMPRSPISKAWPKAATPRHWAANGTRNTSA